MDDPKAYVGKPFDGVWEQTLAAELRSRPEGERAAFISEVLLLQERARYSTKPWFAFANHLVSKANHVEPIVRAGFDAADASTIRYWVEWGAVRLGIRRFLRILSQIRVASPSVALRAEYWLSGVGRTPEEKQAVAEFIKARSTTDS
jgi:hypothetical protein